MLFERLTEGTASMDDIPAGLLEGLQSWDFERFWGLGSDPLSVFNGLGLLAALSKSKAASMALLLTSRSGSIEKPLSRGKDGSILNGDSSLTDDNSGRIQSSDG
jgi:hypothetical protein